jgi:hypothetical protein
LLISRSIKPDETPAFSFDHRIGADEQVPAIPSQSNVRANQFPRSVNRAEPIR